MVRLGALQYPFVPFPPTAQRGEATAMKRIEKALESMMFNSRWLLAPFYVGLIAAVVVLLATFTQEFFKLAPHALSADKNEVILWVLTLIDFSLVANLLLIVIFSGYENFVSKIDVGDHEDRPSWMGKVDYAGMKIKLIASIVAISGIELLKAFVDVKDLSNEDLAWKVGIHLTFVVSGVLLAWMDRIEDSGHGHPPPDRPH
jgi:uncharacterized protein (TIGR00645 family)